MYKRIHPWGGTFALATVILTSMPASGAAQGGSSTAENPFFTESTLPFHYPPFDKIKDSDYVPAFEKGMADQLREVEAIANNPERPTFENTIVALEKSGQLLGRVSSVFHNLNACNTDDEMQRIDSEMAPKLSAENDAIYLNSALFARIKALYDQRSNLGLDAESLFLLERYHRDFVRAGANLSDADKVKMRAVNAELASLQTTFSQNVLKERNADSLFIKDKAELAGLTDEEIAGAAALAKTDNHEGM